ncbi:hypothetical protein SAMN04487949_3143 [Halogranum gelatinilyticum]|uniref:DUF7344 domain-containing protein n=1 Tax=Halogranum gelatinilyticum TaxID=660521 RepID=A0A1G9XWA5_9EURY|nr:hypothetical protein [Halogranum gelatinilyticum]SDN00716.1 hypothetical protein SAMN04487949_3143 [Halogranum gelatinilyticum]
MSRSHGQSREEPPDSEGQEADDVYRILSNRRRRYTLRYLLAHGTAEVRTLAEQIAAWEHDVDPNEVSYDQRRSVYNSLQQSHLPKLQAVNLVAFDKRAGTVELAEDGSEVQSYLGPLTHRQPSLQRRYLLVGGFWLVALPALSLFYPGPTVAETVPLFGVVALSVLWVTLVHRFELDTVAGENATSNGD